MEIPANSSVQTSTTVSSDDKKSKPAIESDFETFLRMLTVQMRNQDPLNPTKAEDFAVQLATFASVEQQVQTNDLLESLQSQMGLSGISQYADWIGKEVKAPTSAHLDGTKAVDVTVAPDPDAESAFLVVKNENGQEVDRLPIAASAGTVGYDGTTVSGLPLPEGDYTFSVENWSADGLDTISQAEVFARIVEARVNDGETVLITDTGAEVAPGEVSALRQPTS